MIALEVLLAKTAAGKAAARGKSEVLKRTERRQQSCLVEIMIFFKTIPYARTAFWGN